MRPTPLRWLPATLWALLVLLLSSLPNPLWLVPDRLIRGLKTIFIFGLRLDNLLWGLSHFFMYAVLAFLLAHAMNLMQSPSPLPWLGAFLVVLAFGMANEVHQIFIPNRGFEWVDILMDGLGGLIGLGVYGVWYKISQRGNPEQLLLL